MNFLPCNTFSFKFPGRKVAPTCITKIKEKLNFSKYLFRKINSNANVPVLPRIGLNVLYQYLGVDNYVI